MPLLSTRSSASSAGYGVNSSQQTGFSPYGYTPYVPADSGVSTALYDSVMSGDGTSYFVIYYTYTTTTANNWYVATYSRNTSTGVLTYVSSTAVVTGGILSSIRGTTSPNGSNLYLAFSNSPASTTEASNFIYQYRIDPTTKSITPLSPAYVNVGTGAGVYWSSFSQDNSFLYVGSAATNKIFIFGRNGSTGALTISNIYSTPVNTLPYCPRVTSDGANLYASSNGTDTGNAILQYSRNIITGNIVPLVPEGVAGGAKMRYLNFNPDFVGIHCNSEAAAATYIYGRDPFTGLLALSATQGGTITRVTYSADGYTLLGVNGINSTKLITTQSPFQGAIDPTYGTVTPYSNPNFNSLQSGASYLDHSPTYDYYYSVHASTSSNGAPFISQWTFTGSYLTLVNSPSTNGSAVNVNREIGNTGNQAPSSLVISPDGKSLYASGYWKGASSGTTPYGTQFDLATSTGIPTRSTSTSYGANQGNGGIAISANSGFLYQVDDLVDPPVIRQYSRNTTTGNLTALGTPTITLPCPNVGGGTFEKNFIGTPFLSVDQKNLYVFVSSTLWGTSTIPQMVQYTRDTSTGLLTFLGSTSLTSASATIGNSVLPGTAILPTDNFVYVSAIYDGSDYGVAVLSRNTTTGVLTLVTQLVTSGTSYYGMVASANGANLYVGTGNQIKIYSINSSTGSLTFVKDFSVGTGQYVFAVKPNGTGIVLSNRASSGNGIEIKLVKRNTANGDLFATTSVFKFYNPGFQQIFGAGLATNASVAISSDSSKFYIVGATLQFGTLT